MSHIVSIQTEVRDAVAVRSACQRLCWPQPCEGEHRLFSRRLTGLGVTVPEWLYPIVCDLASGQLHYDNYSGRWGDPVQLDRFRQAYAVEKTKLEARRQGRRCSEQRLRDGTIQLTVQVEGAVA